MCNLNDDYDQNSTLRIAVYFNTAKSVKQFTKMTRSSSHITLAGLWIAFFPHTHQIISIFMGYKKGLLLLTLDDGLSNHAGTDNVMIL